MKQPNAFFWWDMWMEGLSTAGKLAETMAAVPVVVNRRMPMIGAAVRNPFTADYPELYRMVAEKMEAGTQAAMSLMRDGQKIQAELMRPSRSAAAAAATAMRAGQLAMGASARALAPIHARATANARRLKRVR